ncbi:hypothetical protein E2C01_015322 [Portunus trituberculatus]|uniref:Uncharacterized protein n=1 Tax=Portunus trituberculatus TaxID=210409 RepID=A0A5B7DL18_PORTR|nr:hypothetical protein [Portunus trituberculatus]
MMRFSRGLVVFHRLKIRSKTANVAEVNVEKDSDFSSLGAGIRPFSKSASGLEAMLDVRIRFAEFCETSVMKVTERPCTTILEDREVDTLLLLPGRSELQENLDGRVAGCRSPSIMSEVPVTSSAERCLDC